MLLTLIACRYLRHQRSDESRASALVFLYFWAFQHPTYTEVLLKLESRQSCLDAGCCLGRHIRELIFGGAPSSSVSRGRDTETPFFNLGYQLFRDQHRCMRDSSAQI